MSHVCWVPVHPRIENKYLRVTEYKGINSLFIKINVGIVIELLFVI